MIFPHLAHGHTLSSRIGLRAGEPEPQEVPRERLAGARQDALLLHLRTEDGGAPPDRDCGGSTCRGLRAGRHQAVRLLFCTTEIG